MAKNDNIAGGSYEYRVWGKHPKAREILQTIGSDRTCETIEDCYFLGDDADWNAKVRDSTLKLKRLVDEKRGFEQWISEHHHDGDGVPAPFDQLFDDLHLDRVERGKSFSIRKAVKGLRSDVGQRPVFVTKERIRYRVGSVAAEITKLRIDETGEVMQTLAIVGSDLDELVALRKKLRLKKQDNMAVHVAIDEEVEAP